MLINTADYNKRVDKVNIINTCKYINSKIYMLIETAYKNKFVLKK